MKGVVVIGLFAVLLAAGAAEPGAELSGSGVQLPGEQLPERAQVRSEGRPLRETAQSSGQRRPVPSGVVRQHQPEPSGQQLPVSPREAELRAKWDSIARPPRAAGHEAMRFETERLEAGEIAEAAEPPSYRFVWHNEGRTPLVVTRVTTSCGCLTTAYDKRPVPAGGTGRLTATYHPRRHPGHFDRRIFVYTQLSERQPTAVLSLTGTVLPDADRSADYPVAAGSLRLRRGEVRFEGDRVQTERIACCNAGERPRLLRADTLLTPPCITLTGDPERLEPGAEGDLVIRFDPAKLAGPLPPRAVLVIDGGEVPPRQRTVTVRFGAAND